MEQAISKIVFKNDPFLKSVELMLEEGKKVKIRVKGNSMNPVLKDGDIVVLERGQLPIGKKGDIVLAKYEGKYVLHRIVWRTSGGAYLAGDGNKLQIEKVEKHGVIGIVSTAFRGEVVLPLDVMGSTLQQWGRHLIGFFWYIGYSLKKKML